MWKRVIHLFTGIALLSGCAYFLVGATHGFKTMWRRELAPAARPVESAKSTSASDDPILAAADRKVYGVLSQVGEAKGGDAEAVPLPPSGPPAAFEHVSAADTDGPNHFLHKRLSIKTYQGFEFVVPPHVISPRLEGTFRSASGRGKGAGGSDVELVLMNDQEFADFAHNQGGTTTFSAHPSNHGEIHWALNATFSNPQTYYLVFRNLSERQGLTLVDADFTVSFE